MVTQRSTVESDQASELNPSPGDRPASTGSTTGGSTTGSASSGEARSSGSTSGDDSVAVAVDGRSARRERNRDAVLAAVLELFAEGHLSPSPSQVAQRSGVSLRSVYRYFEDEDQLIRSAITYNMERISPFVTLDRPGVGSLESRILRTVLARLALFDQAAPLMRAATHRAWTTPVLKERLEEVRDMVRQQVADMFEPELSTLRPEPRREALDAIDLVLSYNGLDQLRTATRRSPDEAGAVLRRMLRALLTPTI